MPDLSGTIVGSNCIAWKEKSQFGDLFPTLVSPSKMPPQSWVTSRMHNGGESIAEVFAVC